jgi:signal transduction histidine kinase
MLLSQPIFMNYCKCGPIIEGAGTIVLRTFVNELDVCVEFADTGKGIPPEQLEQLFDPGINARGPRVKAAMGL